MSTIGAIFLIPLLGLFTNANRDKNYWITRVLVFLFFLATVFMFFSIRPILWTTDRYKAEYIVPFVVLGGCLIYAELIRNKFSVRFISLHAFAMLLIGGYGFLTYGNPNQIIIQTSRYARETEISYDYESALKSAKDEGLSGKVVISGHTSGVIPQIISGYTLSEVKESHALWKLPIQSINDWTSVDPILVNNQPEIELVLITDSGDKSLLDKFTKLGWKNWKHFPLEGGGDVVGVVRGGYTKLGNAP
jgi:hypothetical protein